MRVAKWGNSLAVRLPRPVVDGLDLKAGDDVEVRFEGKNNLVVTKQSKRLEALARMRQRTFPLPEGYRFNRDEANDRAEDAI